MSKPKGAGKENDKTREVLDDLIERTYKKFFKREEIEKIKIGELLKMIEQRQKLTPDDLSQKQFWSKLEKIRREALREIGNSTGAAVKKKKTSGRSNSKSRGKKR